MKAIYKNKARKSTFPPWSVGMLLYFWLILLNLIFLSPSHANQDTFIDDVNVLEVMRSAARMGLKLEGVKQLKERGPAEGYLRFLEISDELKDIEAAYPDICRLYNIGESVEGRELWLMKISDHVEMEEDEPEFKYISTMHGDEPLGTALCLNLIHLLTESYETDTRITHLIDEMEIWIMPLMNPDGYMSQSRYNAQGIDLNRNFPDRISDPENTTDGRALEIQHVMNWGILHSPVLAANFHTGALLVNYPYDSDPEDDFLDYAPSPDDDLFIELALSYSSLNEDMYKSSEFFQGISNGVQWYPIYGGMQDWNYVYQGCFELTIEISNDFTPPYSEVPAYWEDNQESMMAYMEWALRGIRGIVTDRLTGDPIPATIRILGIDHDVYTDPDVGDYHRILLPGTYSIQVSAQGYETVTISDLKITEGEAARMDIELYPKGDLNHDARVDLMDLTLILQVLSGKETGSIYLGENEKIGFPDLIYYLKKLSASDEL